MLKTLATLATTGAALAGSLLAAAPAQAQPWGGYGYGYGYDRQAVDGVCSGQRGQMLESRLQREVWEGDIDRRTAADLHWRIDRLQDRERHECREGDFREARDIARQYANLQSVIERESGSGWRYRSRGWNDRGWGGGYGYRGW